MGRTLVIRYKILVILECRVSIYPAGCCYPYFDSPFMPPLTLDLSARNATVSILYVFETVGTLKLPKLALKVRRKTVKQ